MINLLPPTHKRDIAAARTNTLLARYNILMLAAAGFMVVAIAVVYIYFQFAKTQANTSATANTSKAATYANIQNQAAKFRTNLASAKQILSNTTNYPQMIITIAHLLPSGVVLQQLDLDVTTFGKPTTFAANAKSYGAVLALKDNLQNSPLFSDVSIQSVTNNETGTYPLAASLNVTFNKGTSL